MLGEECHSGWVCSQSSSQHMAWQVSYRVGAGRGEQLCSLACFGHNHEKGLAGGPLQLALSHTPMFILGAMETQHPA